MKFTPLALPGLFLIEPTVFSDDRGFFFESFNQRLFSEATGLSVTFAQDNQSKSIKNVLRGLHYQMPPKAQGKLVRVLQGEILDVAVDIRQSSPTFGQHISIVLSAENKHQLWIPAGFAHGFLTLSDTAEMLYKTTEFYSKPHDRGIRWDDETLAIKWPTKDGVILSEKDAQATSFKEAEYF